MRRQSLYVLVIILGAATLLLAAVARRNPSHSARPRPSQATNAAFRDGLYLARVDAESGRAPHLSSGRWATETDRASFIAGYQDGYTEFLKTRAPKFTPHPAELVGFRDGIADGAQHRSAAQPFHVTKTENYRNGGGLRADARSGDAIAIRQYRQAYAAGYQQGYYAQHDRTEVKAAGGTNHRA